MTFTVQHYEGAPIVVLDCPNPLDFYRGFQAAQRDIVKMQKQEARIYWIINLHHIGPFFDLFAKWLTELSIFGRDMLRNQQIRTLVVTSPESIDDAIERFNRKPFQNLYIPVFESLDDALRFCYCNLEQAAVGD